MKKILILIPALSMMALGSCSKNNDSPANPGSGGPSQLHYKIITINKTTPVNAKLTANSSIQWTSGTANPRLVKFEAKNGSSEIEYKSSSSAPVDLMAPVSASFGNFSIPAGTYSEIELKLQLDKASGVPALQMSGLFSGSNASFPVSLVIDEAAEVKTEQKNVTITGSSSFTGVTTFDLSRFTSGITESMMLSAQQTNGTVMISSSSNANLYNIILNNIRNTSHHLEFEHD